MLGLFGLNEKGYKTMNLRKFTQKIINFKNQAHGLHPINIEETNVIKYLKSIEFVKYILYIKPE